MHTQSKILIFFLLAGVLFIACKSPDSARKSVPTDELWGAELNKSEFLTAITNKKVRSEKLITQLRQKNKSSDKLKELYDKVQVSYNSVLLKMDAEINSINNLPYFFMYNSTQQFKNELIAAEKIEKSFIAACNNALELDGSAAGDIFNGLLSFLPPAKMAHDYTLSILKDKVRSKLNQSKFRDWDVVIAK